MGYHYTKFPSRKRGVFKKKKKCLVGKGVSWVIYTIHELTFD